MAKIDLTTLQPYIDDKTILVHHHKTLPLHIYHYTNKAVYENIWTEETKMCRGLVLDNEGTVIARPFGKFFNYGQSVSGEEFVAPNEPFEVLEKADGFMGLLFFYGDQWHFCTSWSFDSESAQEAEKIWNERYSNIKLDKTKTYCFEIISPLTKIIVDYHGIRDLVLIAVRDTETGRELSYEETCNLYPTWTKVCRFDGMDIKSVLNMQKDDEEGFVLLFKSGKRLKVKFVEYIRLSQLMQNLNSYTVWDYLRINYDLGCLLNRVPAEVKKFVEDVLHNCRLEFEKIQTQALDALIQVVMLKNRKEQALWLKDNFKYPSVVFAMLDKHNYHDIIWKLVKPELRYLQGETVEE